MDVFKTHSLHHFSIVAVGPVVSVASSESFPWMVLFFGDDSCHDLDHTVHPKVAKETVDFVGLSRIADHQPAAGLEDTEYLA